MALRQLLDTVRVTGSSDVHDRLRDFEHRRRNAVSGKFFTADDILRLQPNVLTDLLRRVTSVRVDDGGDVTRTKRVVSRRGMALESTPQGLQPRPCELRMAVNGTLLPAGTSMNLIAPTDIAGVEVYAGAASIPTVFSQNGTNSFCGLIVVWTK